MLHIYHPNKNNTGFACSFWYSDRENCVFATILKQSGWDDKSGNGTFKASLEDPTKHVNIKLSEIEVSAILDCVERGRPFSSFHENDEKPKSITFAPWMGKTAGGVDDEGKPVQRGFSFSITYTDKKTADNTKHSFYIGLNFAEARTVREFLIFCLHRRFDALVSRAKQYSSTKRTEPTPEPAAEAPQEQEAPPAEVKKDDDMF